MPKRTVDSVDSDVEDIFATESKLSHLEAKASKLRSRSAAIRGELNTTTEPYLLYSLHQEASEIECKLHSLENRIENLKISKQLSEREAREALSNSQEGPWSAHVELNRNINAELIKKKIEFQQKVIQRIQSGWTGAYLPGADQLRDQKKEEKQLQALQEQLEKEEAKNTLTLY